MIIGHTRPDTPVRDQGLATAPASPSEHKTLPYYTAYA